MQLGYRIVVTGDERRIGKGSYAADLLPIVFYVEAV